MAVPAFTGKFFQEVELPQQKLQQDGVLFPAVLSLNNDADSNAVELSDLKEAIRDHKPWLESLLQKSGAILFRGFPVASPSDFNDVVQAFGYPEFPYVGGRARRTQVIGRVYTANESPPEMGLPFHHEMAYALEFPTKVFFFCDQEPGKGGETPIVLSHILYEKMKERHPEFVALLEEHGVVYTDVAEDEDSSSSSIIGRNWKATYKTDDKNVAVERAAKLGAKLEWIGDVAKITTCPLPAVRFNQESRRNTWFNTISSRCSGHAGKTLCGKDKHVELGNGDPVPDHIVEDYLKILEEECVAIPWKKGDVMLINNLMVLHSRRPLLQPPRRILASLCK